MFGRVKSRSELLSPCTNCPAPGPITAIQLASPALELAHRIANVYWKKVDAKYPKAGSSWPWHWVFPARRSSGIRRVATSGGITFMRRLRSGP